MYRGISDPPHGDDALRKAKRYEGIVVKALPSFIIVLDSEWRVIDWNDAASSTFALSYEQMVGKKLAECKIQWAFDPRPAIEQALLSNSPVRLDDTIYTRPDGSPGILGMSIIPFKSHSGDDGLQCFITGIDITDRRSLEHKLSHAQRMESIGHLAAGVAHEINTPIQYIADNTRFLSDAFAELSALFNRQREVVDTFEESALPTALEALRSQSNEIDLDYLIEEIPSAIAQSLEGLERVGNIVRAMKQFAHPGGDELVATNLNEAISNTITVTRNEWKYDADMITDLDPILPAVPCLVGELNQVILNLIVNAAHAVQDKRGTSTEWKGKITVRTRTIGEYAEISVEDNGTGIPEEHRSKVFDHFYTTKEVGKGTGQGLTLAYSVIKEKHRGDIFFDTSDGQGTTFYVRIPLQPPIDVETEI